MISRYIFLFLAAGAVLGLGAPPAAGFTPGKRPGFAVREGFVSVDGGKLFYEVAGKGEPMVLVHDGMLHSVCYDEQFATFARDYTVVRYDRRGYGRSPESEGTYSNVADLHSLCEQLKLDPAVVIGCSAGGGLAIDFALAHPDRVRALVLVGSIVSGFGFTDHFYTRGGHLDPALREDPAAMRRYWALQDPYEMLPENTAVREHVYKINEAFPHNLDTRKHTLALQPARPALGRLAEVSVPALVIVGEGDMPDVHAHAGAIAAGIPGAERVVVRGAGHLVLQEQPEIFVEQVRGFLRGAEFFAILQTQGVAAAVRHFEHQREADPAWVAFSEARMNQEGYNRLFSGAVAEAIALFKLNVQAYPESWNVYDSLAEAFMHQGETALAIHNYEKSLEMNPDNAGARQRIAELRAAGP